MKTYYCQIFSMLLLLLPLFKAQGGEKILHCLAKEELVFHKNKVTGPVYRLNQKLINELVSLGSVEMRKSFLKYVCSSSEKLSTSLKFLQTALIQGKGAFKLNASPLAHINALNKSNFDRLLEKLPHHFFAYLSVIGSRTIHPYCLYEKVPHFRYFSTRYYYLEGEYSTKDLLKDKVKLKEFFSHLEFIEKYLQTCNKEWVKKKREKKKKKS